MLEGSGWDQTAQTSSSGPPDMLTCVRRRSEGVWVEILTAHNARVAIPRAVYLGSRGRGAQAKSRAVFFCPHMDRGAGGLTGRFPVALENGGARCHNLQLRKLPGDPSHQSKSGHAGLVSRAAAIEVPLGRTPAPPSRTFSVIGTRCELETTVSSLCAGSRSCLRGL